MPEISIVIPTKNRPEVLQVVLKSIQNQTFGDFEVVISDNGIYKSCEQLVCSLDDDRFKYVSTQRDLSLNDSFEFAINLAQGGYVMMLCDKTPLYINALEQIHNVIVSDNIEMLNFPIDIFVPFDSSSKECICAGYMYKGKRTGKIFPVDLENVLSWQLDLKYVNGSLDAGSTMGTFYCGGICKRSFLDELKALHNDNRVFSFGVPDKNALIETLCICKNVFYLDTHILLYIGYGKHVWHEITAAGYEETKRIVLKSLHIKNGNEMLIPNVCFSNYNHIISGYMYTLDNVVKKGRYKYKKKYSVNLGRLAALCFMELSRHKYNDYISREIKLIEYFVDSLDKENQEIFHSEKNKEVPICEDNSYTIFRIFELEKVLQAGFDNEGIEDLWFYDYKNQFEKI